MAKTESIDKALFLKEQRKLLWGFLCVDLDEEEPHLKPAEQLVKSYPTIVSNKVELLDLIIIALEAGTSFLKDFGDIYEDYYDTMSVFWEMLEKAMEPQYLSYFRERLLEIQELSQPIQGYGYADHVDDMIEMIGITIPDEAQ